MDLKNVHVKVQSALTSLNKGNKQFVKDLGNASIFFYVLQINILSSRKWIFFYVFQINILCSTKWRVIIYENN